MNFCDANHKVTRMQQKKNKNITQQINFMLMRI